MTRQLVTSLLIAIVLVNFGMATASAGKSQLFGRRGLGDTYYGVEALMSAQDPALTCCNRFNSAGPVALVMKDVAGQPFIEGGNIKDYRPSVNAFRRHPYWSYNSGGTTGGGTRFDIPQLQPATYYKYTVWNIGSQQFTVRHCRGSSYTTCYTLGTQPMNRNYFSHTTAGGEGNCSGGSGNDCPIGYIAADSNRFLWSNQQWYSYCHTEIHLDYDNAYPMAFQLCNNNARWTVNYR